jgi:hypothetical protein
MEISPALFDVVLSLKIDLQSRFSAVWEPNLDKFDPIFLVASAFDPATAKLLNETEISSAIAFIR